MKSNKPLQILNIDGKVFLHTTAAAKRMKKSAKRVRDFIDAGRLEAVYLAGFYIAEDSIELFQKGKPGRPATKRTKKKTAKE